MPYNTDLIGKAAEATSYDVEQVATVAYAQATNDPIAAHLDGLAAPPVFAVVPAFVAITPIATSVAPPEDVLRTVHGLQDSYFHKQIVPGMTVVTEAKCLGVQGKSTGVTVVIRADTTDQATGELLVEQYFTAFFRGGKHEGEDGQAAPEHPFDEALRANDPVAVSKVTYDTDQTFRYADASGDHMPIHLDDDFAKAMGLEGIIIHGLCTMATNSWQVIENVCPQQPERLKRLALRFNKTAFPGQQITTTIWDRGECESGRSYQFEVTNDQGEILIRDGRAEIEPASVR